MLIIKKYEPLKVNVLTEKINFSSFQLSKIEGLLNFIDANKKVTSQIMWGCNERQLHSEYLKSEASKTLDDTARYFKALDFIKLQSGNITPEIIKQIHTIAAKPEHMPGLYKVTQNNLRVQLTSKGESVGAAYIETAPHEVVEPEINSLLSWLYTELTNKRHHALSVISLFIFEFIRIHPFKDSNGRTSRLITTYLLIQQGYEFARYSSYEMITELHKYHYLENLKNYQITPAPIFNWTATLLLACEEMVRTIKNKP